MARVRDNERKAAAVAILRPGRAHFINYHGRFDIEQIERWRGPEPDIPNLLKR